MSPEPVLGPGVGAGEQGCALEMLRTWSEVATFSLWLRPASTVETRIHQVCSPLVRGEGPIITMFNTTPPPTPARTGDSVFSSEGKKHFFPLPEIAVLQPQISILMAFH